jgi:uncharacterized protein (DUF2345 family)
VYGDTKTTVNMGNYSLGVTKGKVEINANSLIDITSKTDFVHVTSPTEIKLAVGKSTYITITPDNIVLHAAHIKLEGTADTKVVTPSCDINGTTDIVIHGPSTKIQGTSEAKLLGGTVDVMGDSRVTVDGAGSKCDLVQAGATLAGSKVDVTASGGNATVKGSFVNINC